MNNVINDDGTQYELKHGSHLWGVFTCLSVDLPCFDSYLFIIYRSLSDEPPKSRHFVHPKKVLIYESNERMMHDIDAIRSDYLHIFANYHDDSDGVTSLPLGYYTWPKNLCRVPMRDRLYEMSFVGCLNRNRAELASTLSGIPRTLLWLAFRTWKRPTLAFLNTLLAVRHPRSYFKFTDDFSKGLDADQYHYILRNTKVSLCPRGWVNSETFRMYESMRWGAVPVCDELPNRSYYEGIEEFKGDWKEKISWAKALSRSGEALDLYSDRCIAHYDRNMSAFAVANTIRQVLKTKS